MTSQRGGSSLVITTSMETLQRSETTVSGLDTRAIIGPMTSQYSFKRPDVLLPSTDFLPTVYGDTTVILVDLLTQCSDHVVRKVLQSVEFKFVHVFADSHSFREELPLQGSTAVLHCLVTVLETLVTSQPDVTVVVHLPSKRCRQRDVNTCSCSYNYAKYDDGCLKTMVMFTEMYAKLHGLRTFFVIDQ